jgi:drug/metabolite transporter (DMT)-like permease
MSPDLGMLLVALIWGFNFSVTKGAFASFPPLAFTATRFAVASALLIAVQRWLEKAEPLPRGTLHRLLILGVVGNTLYQLGFILGLARTAASNSALILAFMPSLVAFLSAVLGFEPVRPRVLWGVLLATVGVVLVIAVRGAGLGAGTLQGDLLTLAAVCCWAAYTLGLRFIPGSTSALRITSVTTMAGAPGLLLAGLPEMMGMNWSAVGWRGWGALAYSTLFSLVLAYLLWNRSIQIAGPSRTVVYMCLTPLFAVGAAALLLGERPCPLQGAGALLVLAGVWLTRRGPSSPQCPPEDSTISR